MRFVPRGPRAGYYAWLAPPREPPPPGWRGCPGGVGRRGRTASRGGTYEGPCWSHKVLEAGGSPAARTTVAKLMRREGGRRGLLRGGSSRGRPTRPTATPSRPTALDRWFITGEPDRVCCRRHHVHPDGPGVALPGGGARPGELADRRLGGGRPPPQRAGRSGVAQRPGLEVRRPGDGLVHHSDRGVQYACEGYRELPPRVAGIEASMSRAGDCLRQRGDAGERQAP